MLQLFVAGGELHSLRADNNIRSVCETHLAGRHTIEVVNVFECPHAALDKKIFLTPALVKVSPPPQSTIYGNLQDREKVLQALELRSEQ